ncbi:YegP family protein [Pseudomonas lundensis]|uniref:YegP family protein n=1 Tax=Pseudomonas lundensis TaxID=86185 RepID=UPI00147434BE|nr:YegP family protein [Pseudomonas lundensis]NNA20782.1 YegP family protein [Pseudomonas lundensis]
MSGWYELSKTSNGQFRFVLKAANAETILVSEQYSTHEAAKKGIASVQANSPLDERYDRKVAKDGKPYFNLKAANHQIIGTSEQYSTEAAREKGIASVKSNGPTTVIKEKL